ncbi:hypothetical protein JB92DRAFT_3107526 [Gautieria morchelliformis]|nr:hypothetical protein JB92DRAFT_3107526 [Gautieria morchelliformis]
MDEAATRDPHSMQARWLADRHTTYPDLVGGDCVRGRHDRDLRRRHDTLVMPRGAGSSHPRYGESHDSPAQRMQVRTVPRGPRLRAAPFTQATRTPSPTTLQRDTPPSRPLSRSCYLYQLPPTREHILARRTRAGGRGRADNGDREERDIGLMWYNEGGCGDADGKCVGAWQNRHTGGAQLHIPHPHPSETP